MEPLLRRAEIAVLLFATCLVQAQDNADRMNKTVESYVDGKQFMGTVLVTHQNGRDIKGVNK